MSVNFKLRYPSLYTKEFKQEVQATATTTFEDIFSEEVWILTYKDHNDDNINDTIYRVAADAASGEDTIDKAREWTFNFYKLLSGFAATAGGRIYSNAGTEWGGTTLFNCYVSPRRKNDIDSLDGIIEDIRNQAFTLKSEGGYGQNFSYIRPRGSFIHSIGVETPGAVKYMEWFDKTSEIITAGPGKKSTNKKTKGKIRKGACMAVLDVWHPDIIEFITAKQSPGRLTKFNMSVNCTDEFMKKVIKINEPGISKDEFNINDVWELRFPDTSFKQYKKEWNGNIEQWEEKEYPVVVYDTISISQLWNLIMESTYLRNEPGVLFLDRANNNNPGYYFENIISTNPCGEVPLASAGICNLGSINLTQYLTSGGNINYIKLKKYVRYLVRFLDNINDISNFPLKDYEKTAKEKRRVGLGILGWGSMLLIKKIKFASTEAAVIREKLLHTIYSEAYKASIDLAEEKGMFNYCIPEKHVEGKFVQRLKLPEEYINKMKKFGIRNSTLGAIAPNGNTSILANIVSGGLEPIFMPEYIRTVIVSTLPEHLKDVIPKWYEGEWHTTSMFKRAKEGDEEILRGVDSNGTVYKIDKNRGLTKEVLCEDYGVRYLKKLGQWDSTADYVVTTPNLSAQQHLDDLTGFAKYIDQSCSKTINVPNKYSFEDFKKIYLNAYNSGYIKGVTTYRTGTMTTVLSAKEEKHADVGDEEIIKEDVKMPDSSSAAMKTIRAEGKKWYLTVVYHEDNPNRPFALFVKTNAHEKNVLSVDASDRLMVLARKKKIPKRHRDNVEAKLSTDNNSSKVARLISFLLRHGVLIKNIVATLDKVEDAYVGTFVFQIKKFLAVYIKDGEKVEDEKCSECGSTTIVFSEGCKKCVSCGSSKCG